MASARHDPYTTLVVGHIGGVGFFMASNLRRTSWQTFSGGAAWRKYSHVYDGGRGDREHFTSICGDMMMMRVELSSLGWTHGQPKSWTWTTWISFYRWTNGTLFTMRNLDIGWMSSLWDTHMLRSKKLWWHSWPIQADLPTLWYEEAWEFMMEMPWWCTL